MTEWITMLNGGAVSVFGSILSASFCDILKNKKKRRIFLYCLILLLILQAIFFYTFPLDALRKIYPFTTHLPLFVVLYFLTHKATLSCLSILTAYLCCELRRWIGLLAVAVFREAAVQDITELILTVPLLIFLLYFVTPVFRMISDYSARAHIQFGFIPALYYLFDYIARIYLDYLTVGMPVAVEFMPFVCCGAYLVFLRYHSIEERIQNRLKQAQDGLRIQLSQSVREINALRESQEMARQYRHDMRHHLQYLSSCMENGQEETAQTYISDICREMEKQTVERYCENEEINLILSAFAARAKKSGVEMKVHGSLSVQLAVSDIDLCVLLSNALENALNACEVIAASGDSCQIIVQFYEKGKKLYLQVTNPCRVKVCFVNGIPVTNRPGHGIGVQSICTIVERYGGIYSFLQENDQFIFRASL